MTKAGGSYETHHCRTIDLAARLRPYKAKDEGRNERYAVAEEDIFPLERTELCCVVFPEEYEVNITRHGEGPQRVGDHKPVADQLHPDSFNLRGRQCVPLNQKCLELA